MKKLRQIIGYILVLLLILTVSSSKAEQKDTSKVTVSTVYNDMKSGINQNSPKIEKALKELSVSLKTTVDQLWQILVDQQRVYAVGYLIVFLITIGSWYHFWYRYNQGIEHKWDDFNSGTYIIPVIITLVISIVGTILESIHFMDMLTGFFNPKFGALKTITEVAQQLKGD